jgi:hypothetical protein
VAVVVVVGMLLGFLVVLVVVPVLNYSPLVLALQDRVTMAVTEQSIVAHPVTTVAVAVVVRVRSVGRA